MTEKRLFEALSGILEKLPEKEYPETGRHRKIWATVTTMAGICR